MIRIMLVDDEPLFREHIRTVIDWEAYGLSVCCEARNGVEAMEQAELHRPGIVLADINMPFMDGLTLSERLKEKYPGMVIVLITGHSEFEYARKAVRLGIADYILKPFEKEELLEMLLKTKAIIEKEQEEKSFVKDNMEVIRENFFNSLINGGNGLDDEEIKKHLLYFGIKVNTQFFLAASVEIDGMYQRWSDTNEIELWKFAVSNILSDIFETEGNHIVFNGLGGRIISIVELENDRRDTPVIDGYKQLCSLVGEYFDFSVSVGVGRAYKGFKGIRKSYLESHVALQDKFISGSGRAITYENCNSECTNIGFYPSEINEELIIGLRLHDWDNVTGKLENIFNYIRDRRLSADYAYAICMGLISLCLSYIAEAGNRVEDVLGDGFSPYGEIKTKETVEELFDWTIGLFKKTINYSNENKMTKSKILVQVAKEYIGCNYGDSRLSVEVVAHNAYVSSSYLRAAFKKETGMTVSDHITGVRMQKARELLSSGNIKLSEISQITGYSDASYFSKCFKKQFGISPSIYENIKK